MHDTIARDDVTFVVVQRLGYEIFSEGHDMIIYRDLQQDSTSAPYFAVPFVDGQILWTELRDLLEYEGINPAVFLAELEA